jgi:hypothetical protein
MIVTCFKTHKVNGIAVIYKLVYTISILFNVFSNNTIVYKSWKM